MKLQKRKLRKWLEERFFADPNQLVGDANDREGCAIFNWLADSGYAVVSVDREEIEFSGLGTIDAPNWAIRFQEWALELQEGKLQDEQHVTAAEALGILSAVWKG